MPHPFTTAIIIMAFLTIAFLLGAIGVNLLRGLM